MAKIVKTYDYVDEKGNLLYQNVRYEPKNFRQRRPDGNGRWIWNLNGTRRVLYHLPELLQAPRQDWICITEGEKDVISLSVLDFPATTSGNASSWRPEFAEFLRGRLVAIFADNDSAGKRYAKTVANSLHGVATEVRIIELDGLAKGADITDWIDVHDSLEPEALKGRINAMIDEAPPVTIDEGDGPILTCLADVEPTEIKWLWFRRMPLGRITLLVGMPGEGKSFLTTYMAARVSAGSPWPDGNDCPWGSVILISAEDDPADTIRPRLDAHYADVERIHLLSMVRKAGDKGQSREVMFTLADVDALETALKRHSDCKLVVVDPIGSFLGGRTDAHRDNEVRSVLAPVAKLAEKYGVAVVVVAHRRKGGGAIADDLALGSRAFTGIARSVWHLTHDSENKRRKLLLPGKNNLAPEGTGLAFTIGGEPPAISWEREPVVMSADDALAVENGNQKGKPGPEPQARNQAVEWLRDLLSSGPTTVATIKAEAKDAGYAWRTVHRAKDELGIKPYREQFGGAWTWKLPLEATLQDTTCQVSYED